MDKTFHDFLGNQSKNLGGQNLYSPLNYLEGLTTDREIRKLRIREYETGFKFGFLFYKIKVSTTTIMKFILGKKIEMSQIFKEDGTVVPVTLVSVGPCKVTQVKTKDKDGVDAVQIGFDVVKKLNKPEAGHVKDLESFRHLAEVGVEKPEEYERGQEIKVSVLESGAKVTVVGTSKGMGFAGVVKRHHFRGHPKTHGHKDQLRMPGSIGAGGVQRVFKGMRMGGRMGGDRVTIKNLEVVEVDAGKNILALKGAVPGKRGAIILISQK